MRILLIEDELEFNQLLVTFLIQQRYFVDTALDFHEALLKISDYTYDCILIDVTLPKGNGLEIVKQLKRDRSKAGIIIISAKNSFEDKITGLDLGADDYLTKPFNLAELNSRINAVLRRRNFEGEDIIQINELTIKPNEFEVFANGEQVILTKKEFELLLFLVINKNRVVSKLSIAEHLSKDRNEEFFSNEAIYVHLGNLRKKLHEKQCTDYVQNIYGLGYKFNTSL